MAKSNHDQSLNNNLLISEHFEALVNRINVKTESLLAAAADSHRSLTEDKRREINKIGEKQIEKIREIEKINLTSSKIDHLTKHDQIKVEKIIHFDCILFEQPKLSNGLELWITSWYYSEKDLEFLK
jgi:hypothetical protein